MLKVKNLTVKYGDAVIFKNLSFELKPGEILGIRGANGSGKSTLLRALSGINDSAEITGEINYNGKRVEDLSPLEKCRDLGIIFQNPDNQLFSPLVAEEVAFALENLCVKRDEMRDSINSALASLDILELLNKKTNALSGGEKQLVAIAAVTVMRPKILICDEITSRVDIERKKKVRDIVVNYAAGGGSIIIVSHSEKELLLADNVIELEKGRDYACTVIKENSIKTEVEHNEN